MFPIPLFLPSQAWLPHVLAVFFPNVAFFGFLNGKLQTSCSKEALSIPPVPGSCTCYRVLCGILRVMIETSSGIHRKSLLIPASHLFVGFTRFLHTRSPCSFAASTSTIWPPSRLGPNSVTPLLWQERAVNLAQGCGWVPACFSPWPTTSDWEEDFTSDYTHTRQGMC